VVLSQVTPSHEVLVVPPVVKAAWSLTLLSALSSIVEDSLVARSVASLMALYTNESSSVSHWQSHGSILQAQQHGKLDIGNVALSWTSLGTSCSAWGDSVVKSFSTPSLVGFSTWLVSSSGSGVPCWIISGDLSCGQSWHFLKFSSCCPHSSFLQHLSLRSYQSAKLSQFSCGIKPGQARSQGIQFPIWMTVQRR